MAMRSPRSPRAETPGHEPPTSAPAWLHPHAEGAALRVIVVPNASRSALHGVHADALRVRVAAVPVDGRANDALLAFLADALGLPRRAVRLDAGHGSRVKRIVVALPPARVLERLQPLLDEAAR